ncbi:hypothetical protein [Aestuariivirga sp.]|uniref:hypothetical protein n=1 Tax=Aestuariivirga sp. TaxID=2650926 RepID=UPI00391D42F2
MSSANDVIRVVIPLAIRRRNGRPRVLPPEDVAARQTRAQDPHILKALGRAWAWRRKLESGEMATVGDIAKSERVTDRFVSRTMRLAYLSPDVLERLILLRQPPAVSWNDLVHASYFPWAGQMEYVLDHEHLVGD